MMTTALETKCVVLMDARMSVWTPYPRNQVNTRFNTTGPCLAHGNRGEGVPCPYPVPLSRFPPLFCSISWRFSIANYYTMLSNIFPITRSPALGNPTFRPLFSRRPYTSRPLFCRAPLLSAKYVSSFNAGCLVELAMTNNDWQRFTRVFTAVFTAVCKSRGFQTMFYRRRSSRHNLTTTRQCRKKFAQEMSP